MKLKLTVIVACFICSTALSQIQWPAITQTAKPWTRWWWQGSAVNKNDLSASLRQYQQAGLGGLEITPIYGVKGYEDQFIDFLSPKWVEMLLHTLQESKKLNLGVDMATGTGWPFGGPWVTPDDACKNINLKTYSLKAGESLPEAVQFIQQPMVRTVSGKPVDTKTLSFPIATNKNLQSYAFDQVRFEKPLPLQVLMAYSDANEIVDLTDNVDANGKLNWIAPKGNWTLYALFQGWHGKMVERAAPGGEGDVIDHFAEKPLKNYLAQFDRAFGSKDINYLRCFFNDSYEVDDARGQANWTPDFFNEFKKRRSYDLREHLPALFQREATDKHSRVLYDYRQTISELLLEKFTTPWDDWAKAKGKIIRNQSHGSPANILDLYAAIDIPETEGANILRFKFATSTANVMGKPLASAEAATWLNEHFQSSLGDVKLALDKYFVGGVNHVFYHGTNYSPQNDPWPGWLFYAAVHFTPANPFWRNFSTLNNYVANVQSFLQRGKPNNDILLYFPINDRFSEPLAAQQTNTPRRNPNAYTESPGTIDTGARRNVNPDTANRSQPNPSLQQPLPNLLQHFDGMEGFDNTVFESSAEFLLKEGYAFDLISDKQLLQVKPTNQVLQTGGITYQTILLSDCKYIPLPTLNALLKLAESGAAILIYKNIPSDVPGYGNLERNRNDFKKLLAGLQFNSTENPAVMKAAAGKGFFLMGNDLPQLLSASKLRREPMVDQGLLFARRQYEKGTTYFISNGSDKTVENWIPLSVKAVSVVLFDPMFKRSGLAKSRKAANGNTEVFVRLLPGESCILQTSSAFVQGNMYQYPKPVGEPFAITGNWEMKFLNGGPTLPATTQVTQLGSWTDLPGEEVKKFSGTAQYSINFNKPTNPGGTQAWILDLGKVSESAEVLLNGKKIVTLIGPAFQTIIPVTQLSAHNLLQINITNGMANRIADLDKRGIEWKKFYNTNFPSRLAENRGPDGLFTAAKWRPKLSGLMGPVTLTAVEFMK